MNSNAEERMEQKWGELRGKESPLYEQRCFSVVETIRACYCRFWEEREWMVLSY